MPAASCLREPAADDAHRARAVRRPDLRHAERRGLQQRQAPAQWLEKFYSLNENWQAEDRRKLLAFARDLLNSDYAGHRLTFVQFAQAPHFNHLAAVYNASISPARSTSCAVRRACPSA